MQLVRGPAAAALALLGSLPRPRAFSLLQALGGFRERVLLWERVHTRARSSRVAGSVARVRDVHATAGECRGLRRKCILRGPCKGLWSGGSITATRLGQTMRACTPGPGEPGEQQGSQGPETLCLGVASADDMESLGAVFGADVEAGDAVLLTGDLGTGKTCFARGFIRGRVGDASLRVTSPSYLLDNTYEAEGGDLVIHHMDLYRLAGPSDLHVLDIPRVLESCVCLVEWPDRLGDATPSQRLDIHLEAMGEDQRVLTATGYGEWWAGAVRELQDNLPALGWGGRLLTTEGHAAGLGGSLPPPTPPRLPL